LIVSVATLEVVLPQVFTTAPAQTFVPTGFVVTLGLLIVSVATLEVVLPQVLENTARNWLLLCEMLAVKLSGLDVAPGMLVNAPPLLACHCSAGTGVPPATDVNDTTAPAQTFVLTGFAVTTARVLTVKVATAEVMLPQVLENTARYWLLLCEALTVKLNGLLVAPGMLVKLPPLLACHCNVGAGVPLAAAVNDTTVPVQALVLSGSVVIRRLLIVSVATAEVLLPHVLENTARY
jgi:hypothetical protein